MSLPCAGVIAGPDTGSYAGITAPSPWLDR